MKRSSGIRTLTRRRRNRREHKIEKHKKKTKQFGSCDYVRLSGLNQCQNGEFSPKERDWLNMVVSWEFSIVETFFRIHLRPIRPFMVYNCSAKVEIPIFRILMELSRQNLLERRDATKPQPQPARGGDWKIKFSLLQNNYTP